jgi:transmembrane sensor
MAEKLNDDILTLISKNLEGVASEEENLRLHLWISVSETNRKYYLELKNIWEASSHYPFHDKIDPVEGLKRVKGRISIRQSDNRLWVYMQRIAAILLIPVTIGTILFMRHRSEGYSVSGGPVYNEVYAAFGTRSALKLADSTLVWLNSGSSLRYPDRFTGKNREVDLKGEAYFEVKSDVSHPFIVRTSNFMVKATGTKFNVLNYESNRISEVTLVSGKVSVNELTNGDKSNLISKLGPNQHLNYDKQNKTICLRDEDSYKYYAWKDGKLIFRNEPLSDVVKKIGQVFNVDIQLKGSELQEYRYRATFQDESLEEILRLLKLTSPVDYAEIKRTPLPDGSFPKKQVIIFQKNLIKSN